MTWPEHLIFGAVISHLGFHQRWGTRITPVMVIASGLPDVDALFLLGGQDAYFRYHRTATHSLIGAVTASLLLAALCILVTAVARRASGPGVRSRRLDAALRFLSERTDNPLGNFPLVFGVSLLATTAHILVDALYPWPVPLFWPFGGPRLCVGVLDWGDRAVLGIMVAAMFALGIFRRRTRWPAAGGLCLLSAYVGARLVFTHWPLPPAV